MHIYLSDMCKKNLENFTAEKKRKCNAEFRRENSAKALLTPFLYGEKNRISKRCHKKQMLNGASPPKQNQGTNVRQQKKVKTYPQFLNLQALV